MKRPTFLQLEIPKGYEVQKEPLEVKQLQIYGTLLITIRLHRKVSEINKQLKDK